MSVTASSQTVSEVATRYGVTAATVRAWIASGELKAVNVSRSARSKKPRWRVTSAALAAFEELRKPASTPTTAPRRRRSPGDVVQFYK